MVFFPNHAVRRASVALVQKQMVTRLISRSESFAFRGMQLLNCYGMIGKKARNARTIGLTIETCLGIRQSVCENDEPSVPGPRNRSHEQFLRTTDWCR